MFSTITNAQTTSIEGFVFDGETGMPLLFVTINFKNTNIGTTTDLEGKYIISSHKRVTTLNVSLLGYTSQSIFIQLGIHQKIDISLEPKRFNLSVAEVRPDRSVVNLAKNLMNRVVDAKSSNDPKNINAITHRFYERIELDFNDVPHKLPTRKFWGEFRWIWSRLDSSESRISLPWFISESLGSIRTQGKPYRTEKIVEQTRSTWSNEGLNTSSFTTQIFNIDFYQNQFVIFDKAFISPLNNRGELFYRYYILDTLKVDDRSTFHVAFVPRRRGEYTFEGELWIDTLTLGLKKVESKISESAYTNYIRSMNFTMNYALRDDKWILLDKEDIFDIAYSRVVRNLGFYLKNTTVYYDHTFKDNWHRKDWTSRRDLSFVEGSYSSKEEDWIGKRPKPLTNKEEDIYQMVDSIQSMPQYNLLKGSFYSIITGRVKGKNFEFGPISEMYSYNNLEGNRFGIKLYTTNKLHSKFLPSVSLAYGTRDKELKHGVSLVYLKSQIPRKEYSLYYKKDLQQIGARNLYQQGSILNSAFNLDEEIDLSMVSEMGVAMSRDFGRGFNAVFQFLHKRIEPRGDQDIIENINPVISSESSVMLIYTKDAKFINRWRSKRNRLNSRTPVYTFISIQGWEGVLGSQYSYGKYKFDIAGQLRMGPLGRIDYNYDLGTHTGKLPFTLLEAPPSNQNLLTKEYGITFELLRNMEYVTDTWSKAYLEWHGEGFLFRYIPVIKRLKIREVVGIKGVYGVWDPRHEDILKLPEGTTGLDGFYGEAVIGLENIFNFMRVEFNLRLTNKLDNPKDNWAVRLGFALEI